MITVQHEDDPAADYTIKALRISHLTAFDEEGGAFVSGTVEFDTPHPGPTLTTRVTVAAARSSSIETVETDLARKAIVHLRSAAAQAEDQLAHLMRAGRDQTEKPLQLPLT